jgi:hypothetical protein
MAENRCQHRSQCHYPQFFAARVCSQSRLRNTAQSADALSVRTKGELTIADAGNDMQTGA